MTPKETYIIGSYWYATSVLVTTVGLTHTSPICVFQSDQALNLSSIARPESSQQVSTDSIILCQFRLNKSRYADLETIHISYWPLAVYQPHIVRLGSTIHTRPDQPRPTTERNLLNRFNLQDATSHLRPQFNFAVPLSASPRRSRRPCHPSCRRSHLWQRPGRVLCYRSFSSSFHSGPQCPGHERWCYLPAFHLWT